MTKKEQIAALLETIHTGKTGNRKAAWEAIQEMKKQAKVSYEKLGISTEVLAQIPSLLEANAPKKVGRKTSNTRDMALAHLGLVADQGRSAKIQYLVEKMGITKYNAMYYVDRVAKSA